MQDLKTLKLYDPERILSAIERIDKVIQLTSNVRLVLDNVIHEVFQIFQSDRAWLFFPCNPNVPSFDVAFESSKPAYPGAKSLKEIVPMTRDMAGYCHRALSQVGEPDVDPVPGHEMTNDIALRFNVKSLMFMALHPQIGDPWMFGLHQCDHGRVWTEEDKTLFKIIGRRITDCIGNMLYLKQLRESERKWRNILINVPQMGITLDAEARIVFANAYFLSLTGWEEEEVMGRNWFDLFIPEHGREDVRNVFHTVMSQKDTLGFSTYENEILDRSGNLLNVAWSNVLTKDSNGKLVDVTCLGVDLTERRRNEQKLKNSEARYRTILESAMDGFWVTDTTGRLIEVNEAYCVMSGYSANELFCMGISDLEVTEDSDAVKEHMQKVIEKGIDRFESKHRRKDGTVFDVEVSIQFRPEEGGECICFIRDISEQKKAFEAIKTAHKRMKLAADSARFGIWDLNIAENRLQWDDWMFRLYGISRKNFGGAYEAWQAGVHPDDLERGSKEVEQALRGEKEFDTEFRIVRPGGEVRHIKANAVVSRDKKGNPVQMTGINYDITENKRAEKEREELEGRLHQAQKMEAVGRLAGGVAHDFNNMLSLILGHAEMALEDVGPDRPLYARLKEIKRAGERSADLTRQLLAFARKQTVSPRVLEFNKTVSDMTGMLQRLIGEDIDLAWIPGKDVWRVKMDPSQVDQILVNLCVNARDAIADVGKVTIETGNADFDEQYCSDHPEVVAGEYVVLAVSDNGRGMDAGTLENIFEPFFTTKKSGKGTGLGLATVYGVARQNNGFVNVYSEPGQGTTFRVYFPRHRTRDESPMEKAGEQPAERGHETILLVEDEPSILELTQMMLQRLGYQVLTAGTPGEAIRLAREYGGEIHLLMTDVVMPEMNGRDLAKNILSMQPNLKRLFMSGYTANVIAHHGVLDEGVNFIQKPFSMEKLGTRVREALEEVAVLP